MLLYFSIIIIKSQLERLSFLQVTKEVKFSSNSSMSSYFTLRCLNYLEFILFYSESFRFNFIFFQMPIQQFQYNFFEVTSFSYLFLLLQNFFMFCSFFSLASLVCLSLCMSVHPVFIGDVLQFIFFSNRVNHLPSLFFLIDFPVYSSMVNFSLTIKLTISRHCFFFFFPPRHCLLYCHCIVAQSLSKAMTAIR